MKIASVRHTLCLMFLRMQTDRQTDSERERRSFAVVDAKIEVKRNFKREKEMDIKLTAQ